MTATEKTRARLISYAAQEARESNRLTGALIRFDPRRVRLKKRMGDRFAKARGEWRQLQRAAFGRAKMFAWIAAAREEEAQHIFALYERSETDDT